MSGTKSVAAHVLLVALNSLQLFSSFTASTGSERSYWLQSALVPG